MQLEVWREACRHIRIGEAVQVLVALLGRRIPVERMIVGRVHLEERIIETVADGTLAGEPSVLLSASPQKRFRLEAFS